MRKSFVNFLTFLFAGVFFISCELGLGSAVDTESAVIAISCPATDSIIKDDFTVYGTWSDDSALASVQLCFERTDAKAAKKNADAEITTIKASTSTSDGNGTWSYTVKSSDLTDGTYEVTVTATDNGGHKSKTSCTFTVDNTSPLIILQRPSSNAAASDANTDSFGQTFTLEGQAVDDNDVALIELNFFDSSDSDTPIYTITKENVPPTIEEDIAVFKLGEDNDYASIYGASEKEGTKFRYCQVIAYDNAKSYNPDGSVKDQKGNKSQTYYLYNDISTSILSEYSLKVTQLYKILSGVYQLDHQSDAEKTKIASVNQLLTDCETVRGRFSLNPENSPKFAVSGRDTFTPSEEDTTGLEASAYALTNGNQKIIVEVQPGLDGHTIVPDSVGVYLQECSQFGVVSEETAAKDPVWLIKPAEGYSKEGWTEIPAGADKAEDSDWADNKRQSLSGSTYKFTSRTNLSTSDYSGLFSNCYYKIGVVGRDAKGNSILSDADYCFKLVSSGTNLDLTVSPSEILISPDAAASYKQKTVTLNIVGSGPFIIKRSFNNVDWEILAATSLSKYEDVISAEAAAFENSTPVYYKVFQDSSVGDATSNAREIHVKVDDKTPVISMDEVPSTAKTEVSSFRFKGTIDEAADSSHDASGISSVEISFYNGSSWSDWTSEDVGFSDTEWSYTLIYADNAAFSTEGPKAVKVRAADAAGHVSSGFVYNTKTVEEAAFIFDTANPSLSIDSASITQFMSKTGLTLSGTASDNYGLKQENENQILTVNEYYAPLTITDNTDPENPVVTTVDPADSSYYSFSQTAKPAVNDGKWSLSVPLIANVQEGYYKYKITATDNAGKTTDKETAYITVDTTKPVVLIDTPKNNTGTNAIAETNFRFAGTVTEAGGLSEVWYKITEGNTAPAIPSSDLLNSEQWTAKGWNSANGGTSWNFSQKFISGTTNGSDSLCENSYTLYVYATDKAGNLSDAAIEAFDVDLTSPSIETKYVTAAGETTVTNNTTQTVTASYTFKYRVSDSNGFNPENTSVSVYKDSLKKALEKGDNGFTVSDADENGWYTVTITGTAAGDDLYTYTVNAEDKVGKTESETRNIRLDTTAPDLKIVSPDLSSYQNSQTVTVSGSSEDASGTNAVYYAYGTTPSAVADGESALLDETWTAKGWTKASGTTSWKITGLAGTEGTPKTLTIAAADKNGKVKQLESVSVKIDLSIPSVTSEITATVYKNAGFTLKGTASDNNGIKTITIKDTVHDLEYSWQEENNPGTVAFENGNWSKALTIDQLKGDGSYNFTVTAEDAAGKTNYVTAQVFVDTKAPKGTVSITSTPAAYTKKDGTTVTYDKNNPPAASDVERYWYANNGQISITLTPSDEAPSSGISTAESTINAQSETASWASLTQNDSVWNGNINTQNQGSNTISFKVTDKAGNSTVTESGSTWNSTIVQTVFVDTAAPDDINVFSVDGTEGFNGSKLVNKKNNVVFVLTANDANDDEAEQCTGIKSVNLTKIGTTTVSAAGTLSNGKWTVTIPAASLTNGAAVFTVTDMAGNQTSYTSDVLISVDTSAPVSKTINLPSDADSSTAGVQVNKAFTLSGITNDNQTISSVDVSYYIDDSTTGNRTWKHLYSVPSDELYSWSTSIDSTSGDFGQVTDGTTVYFAVVVIDAAGNSNISKISASAPYVPADTPANILASNVKSEKENISSVIVSQDSDRPVVHLLNMDCTGMAKTSPIWCKQTSLQGTVNDDDGSVTSVKISSDGGTSWTDELLSNGLWEYKITDALNGNKSLLFKITDADGTVFIAGEALENTYSGTKYKTPKLQDSNNAKFGYSGDSVIYTKIDTVDPVIQNAFFTLDDASAAAVTSENITAIPSSPASYGFKPIDSIGAGYIGGPDSHLYVLYIAKDDNGIALSSEKAGTVESQLVYPAARPATTDGSDVYQLVKFNLSQVASGTTSRLNLTVQDQAGRTNERNISLQVDNEKPVVSIISHSNGSEIYGSLSASVNGHSEDTNAVSKLYYAVTKDSTAPAATDYTEITDYVSVAAWSITFDGGVNTNTGTSTTYHAPLLNTILESTDLYGSGASSKADSYTAYLHLYAEDEFGNLSDAVTVKLTVLTQTDKPSVTIEYPSSGETVGGTIRLNGTTTIQSDSVASVWLQIDPDYNGVSFNESWRTSLSTLLSGKTVDYKIESGAGTTDGYGIKANGSTQSWNLTINTVSEFEKSDNTNRTIAVRAYAISTTNKKISNPVTTYFTVDPDSPVFGDAKELVLVNKADSSKTMKYESGMWISGEWYLQGSVQDESGIKTLAMGDEALVSNGSAVAGYSAYVSERTDSVTTSYKNYNLNIPVGAATGYGADSFTLKATEGGSNGLSSSIDILIRYDNNAPSGFTAAINGSASALKASGNIFRQSNGQLSLKGNLEENGYESGFGRVAFYFTRTIDSTTYFVDPMITKDKGSGDAPARYRNNYAAVSGLTLSDGLYWLSASASISSNQLTVSAVPANVRIGGLCKVNNVIYRIEDISGTTITLDGRFTDADSVTVYFALAQVIDNTVTEGGNTTVYGASDSMTNGDGDQMVEGVTSIGSTYTWEAAINSQNLYDGPVTLHFAYFDAAGNGSTASYEGTISNNAPRLAGVTVGSDYDGDGTISADESQSTYFEEVTRTVSGVSVKKSASVTDDNEIFVVSSNNTTAGTAFMTLKDKSVITPELIGGNGKLYYSYKIGTDLDNPSVTGNNTTSFATGYQDNTDYITTDDLTRNYVAGHTADIALALSDFDSIPNSTVTAPTWFQYTIWDETDGTTKFTDSQNTVMQLKLAVQVHDTENPTAEITPFHWTDTSDNSLYQNSKSNGHIELEADWKNASGYKNAANGEYDGDPKVSGKITITGYAQDNIRLHSLWIKLGTNAKFPMGTNYLKTAGYGTNGVSGEYRQAAVFANGSWTTADATIGTDGWEFHVSEAETDGAYLNNTGHKVKWTLYIDTEKCTNASQADVETGIMAVDKRSSLTNSAAYKMDIVPYITGVTTNLSSMSTTSPTVYSRTALGNYPVKKGETLSIQGFNFGTAATVKVGTTAITGTTSTNNAITKVALGENSSNAITVTTGTTSLVTINNMNSTSAEYNLMPNGKNNDLLSDDVNLKVWEFKTLAEPVAVEHIMYPTVKMNPADGRIGASFANSYFFHMAGYRNNGTTDADWYSHAPFLSGYDGADANTFVFDKNGYTYGTVQYATSDGPSEAGSFNFVFSTAKPEANLSRADTYRCNTGSSRLENNATNLRTSPTTEATEWSYNKWRIKSPSMVAVANSNSTQTTVHVAYYDSTTQQIRYRKGVVNAADLKGRNIGFTGLTPNKTTTDGKTISSLMKLGTNDSLVDLFESSAIETTGGYAEGNIMYYPYSAEKQGGTGNSNWDPMKNSNFGGRHNHPADSLQTQTNQIIHVIASNGLTGDVQGIYMKNDKANGHQYMYGAGAYVSLGVLSDDSAVIAWYDSNAKKLYISKAKDSDFTGNSANGNAGTNFINSYERTAVWEGHTVDLGSGGEYVKLVVDSDNYIHIAHYDSSNGGELKYIKLNSSLEIQEQATVDCYEDVGSKLTLNVAKSGNNQVPYIGYYGRKHAKMAYRVNFGTGTAAGCNDEDKFTQNWEISYVPTEDNIYDCSENQINVAVWTTTTGDLGSSPSGTDSEKAFGGTANNGASVASKLAYANGTANPVIAYIGASGSLDYAQIK